MADTIQSLDKANMRENFIKAIDKFMETNNGFVIICSAKDEKNPSDVDVSFKGICTGCAKYVVNDTIATAKDRGIIADNPAHDHKRLLEDDTVGRA